VRYAHAVASEGDDELKTQTCVDCSDTSPPISTNYTLIGTHGWRLTRRTTTDGDFVVEWRCAACWAAMKRASSAPAAADPEHDDDLHRSRHRDDRRRS